MRPHRRGQRLRRHIHELRVNCTDQRHGPFDQPGNFVLQRRIIPDRQPFGFGLRLQFALDDRAAFRTVDENEGIAQPVAIFGKPRNGNRIGRQKTVAAGGVSRRHAVALQVNGQIDCRTIEDGQHAVQRTDPAKALRAPAH